MLSGWRPVAAETIFRAKLAQKVRETLDAA